MPVAVFTDEAASRLQAGCRLLFERNPLPMWVHDIRTQRMLAVNQAALTRYGYSREEFAGLTLRDLQEEDEAAPIDSLPPSPVKERGARQVLRHRHHNGERLEVEVESEDIVFDGLAARLMLVRDVTELRLLEEREMLAAVIDATTDAVVSLDAEGRIRIFNPAAERIFGHDRSSVLGQPLELLLPERYRAAHPAQRQRFSESGSAHRTMGLGRVKGLRADGQEIDLEGTLSQVSVQQQKFTIASLRDVTESLVIQAEFLQSQALLSELTHKLMTQEKVLVKRLAQALHDQLGQTMAAIRMCHETIMTLQRDKASTGIDRHEAQLGALINQAIREIRQVLVDLRPPLLDEQGLAAALDNELRNRALTRPEMDISIHISPDMERMRWPAEVEYAVFMIAREAIENALRHSGASSVSICLSGSASSVQLEVADNGVGFKTDGAKLRAGHLGILGMRERAHAIAATVRVNSAEASGTRVSCSWSSAS